MGILTLGWIYLVMESSVGVQAYPISEVMYFYFSVGKIKTMNLKAKWNHFKSSKSFLNFNFKIILSCEQSTILTPPEINSTLRM